jgi:hypothetical protein
MEGRLISGLLFSSASGDGLTFEEICMSVNSVVDGRPDSLNVHVLAGLMLT